MNDLWVEWKKLNSNPQVGDIAVNPHNPNWRYVWGKDPRGHLNWLILCEIPDCNEEGLWGVGNKTVCDKHKLGSRFVLYRHWNDEGLLYVGITNDPPKRAREHRLSSDFWAEVIDGGYTTYELFATREDLLKAEKEAIQNEYPKYNKQHNMIEAD